MFHFEHKEEYSYLVWFSHLNCGAERLSNISLLASMVPNDPAPATSPCCRNNCQEKENHSLFCYASETKCILKHNSMCQAAQPRGLSQDVFPPMSSIRFGAWMHANRMPVLNTALSLLSGAPYLIVPLNPQPSLPVTLFKLGSCEYLRSMKSPGGALWKWLSYLLLGVNP